MNLDLFDNPKSFFDVHYYSGQNSLRFAPNFYYYKTNTSVLDSPNVELGLKAYFDNDLIGFDSISF